ncbi:MAG: efflux RND transporter periplasmic adaptor subunit [Spirosomaceae bacterium]|jgi:membrane fusion protein (multidrug efflux system)|nr:efflux RND transporter periplasmic adaptor subunit [Spirosomataceae bacterium]
MKHLLIGILAATVMASCTKEENQQKQVAENFPVTSPIVIDTSLHTDYVAEIHAVQNVEIRARVKGFLEAIHIDEGKYVAQGQLLFSISNSLLKEQLAQATATLKSTQAELKAAELEMANIKRLVEKNVVSTTEFEAAKNKVEIMAAKVEQARAEESAAKIHLTYSQIKAPFSGIVNRIPNKIGSLIEDGTLLTSISKNDEVFAYFDVSEKEYLNFMTNMKADNQFQNNLSLILANGEEHPFKGKIETTEAEIEQGTGNIAFRARFANPQKILKHGASGKVRLLKKHNDALVIPQKATFEIQDRIYVYVLDNKNRVKSKAITVNNRMSHFYIVDAGLSPDDRIIYEGIQNVKDGMIVNPQFMQMNAIKTELAAR